MKITSVLKIAGLLILAISFVTPWYVWGIELVGDKVIINMFNLSLSKQVIGDPFEGGINKLWMWQLIAPRSLVRDEPLMRGSYLKIEGMTSTDLVEDIGIKWAIVPALTLLMFIVALVLSFVRMQKMLLLMESLTPLVVGVCIIALLLLWNPVPPELLKEFKPTPSLGKYATILGALLLAISGFISLFDKRFRKAKMS